MTKIIKYTNLIITLGEEYLDYYIKLIIRIIINTINIFNIYEIKKTARPFQIIYKNKIGYSELRKLFENRDINIKIGSTAILFRILNINL